MTHTLNKLRLNPLLVTLVMSLLMLGILVLLTDASALNIATNVNKNATQVCSEMKSIASGPWPKVFLFGGGALAIWGIFRKERDGFTNLIWVAAFASIFAGMTGILNVFGIGC